MVHVISYDGIALENGLLSRLDTLDDADDYTVIPLDDPRRTEKFARFLEGTSWGEVVYCHGVFRRGEIDAMRARFELFEPLDNASKMAEDLTERDNTNFMRMIPTDQLCFGFDDFWMQRFLRGDYCDKRNAHIKKMKELRAGVA